MDGTDGLEIELPDDKGLRNSNLLIISILHNL
jgi:hypothetical protein